MTRLKILDIKNLSVEDSRRPCHPILRIGAVSSCAEVMTVTNPADLTDAEIAHRLSTIGAQWHVASDGRKVRLHVVVDALLDEQAVRAHSTTSEALIAGA